MKKTVFRSVEFWKSSVMTMPDNSFFELIRSVFGRIKTPFNKQQLINDLEAFLLRGDVQQTITGYIDQKDAKVIAAAALFGEPVFSDLESFFSGEMSYAELQDVIVNLEERFILYRFREENAQSRGFRRLALNPVLERVLLPFAVDAQALFPTVEDADTVGSPAPQSAIDDRILAGVFSFVSRDEPFFRTEGVIRKKVIEAGKTCFPGFNMALVLEGLQALGLLYVNEDRLLIDRKRRDDFGALSPRERMEYLSAAVIVHGGSESAAGVLPPLLRGRIGEIAAFIHCLLDSLDAGRLYPETTLIRLMKVIMTDMQIALANDALADILTKMEITGLLQTVSPKIKRLGINAVKKTDANREGPLITIDSVFSILFYPEISYADAVSLASVLNIKEAGPLSRFELDKDSCVRAFDRNVSADEIIGLLTRLSDGRVSDNLVWTLKDWEKRHGEVSLKKGVVLSLAEEKRYLTETMALSGLIAETLAPGLYLLPEGSISKAVDVLKAAGIDIIARRESKPKAAASVSHYFPSPSWHKPYNDVLAMTANSDAALENPASALTARFHAMLEKTDLSNTVKTELSARIDRKLVLCETQLADADIRYEKLEARHMDYAGKQNIARQAVAQQSPVEVVWGGGNGGRVFGVPKALEKEGGEFVLVITPASGAEALRVPLGKMSLIRRIKKSIFEIS
jgi:hypothetical protein